VVALTVITDVFNVVLALVAWNATKLAIIWILQIFLVIWINAIQDFSTLEMVVLHATLAAQRALDLM